MSETLLPCPFCGETNIKDRYVRDGRQVYCPSCHASAGPEFHGPKGDTNERADAAWNARAGSGDPAPSGNMPDQEGLHQIIYKHLYRCLDGGVVPDGFLTADLWKATEAAAAEITGAAPPVRSAASTVEPVPFAWVLPGDDTARDDGFIDARIDREGEFTKPLYTTPPNPVVAENATTETTARVRVWDEARGAHFLQDVPNSEPNCSKSSNGSPEPDAVRGIPEEALRELRILQNIGNANNANVQAAATRILAALSRPAHGGWEAALRQIMQRANESGAGEMALMDTIHAMHRLAADALARNDRGGGAS